jgi:NTE family protein
MALEDEHPSSERETRRPIECLRACVALADVEPATLEALAAAAVQFSVPAGTVLFEAGTPSDGMYLLNAGRLGVRTAKTAGWTAQIYGGELIGELGWLMGAAHSAAVVAIRDSELLWMERGILDELAARSPAFSLSMARLCAERLHRTNQHAAPASRARTIAVIPNSPDVDTVSFARLLAAELARAGRTELVWDQRASSHTVAWFNGIEESHDFVVYLADSLTSGWTRQCCRQADVLLLVADARESPRAWPHVITATAATAGVTTELALIHDGALVPGSSTAWLAAAPSNSHHHILDASDIARLARLLTHRGVGLVLSGGGARGFAHLGVIRALREARVPIDFVGGASIGGIIAAGAGMGWSDQEMRMRYQRSFVDTNPVNDYTFPFVALTRGLKVSRLLRHEFGETLIEDLRLPFFCVSANLTTGRTLEHRQGILWQALRASVAIPGVLPPVFQGEDVLVDGAAINNLPVDLMKNHAPGFVIGSDVGSDRPFTADYEAAEQPPFWRLFSNLRGGQRRINIFQILMRAGMIGSDLTALAQREMADVILKPPLGDVDLLNWQAFERAIEVGYEHTREMLARSPQLPRVAAEPSLAPARPFASLQTTAAHLPAPRRC